MFARILVPLDGSPFAEAAVPAAISLAERHSGEVHRAYDVPAAKAYLDGLSQRLRGGGLDVTNRVVRSAGAAQLVLEAADDSPVVMATRGRGPLGRALLGSVTDKIVRGAVGPVLVIPARVAEETAAAAPST